ncbi:uncharacterized protein N7515_005246 [Penicillium bovifimosum]|uniref:Type 1 phosphatases regulator n=1 Tax=Penicillium bovifimosum TaxID=126998 RepID=A0A9W9GSD5_9EURO|nr:uncharacterized protein N7515_005246 [Penicillium bovifimosum]KAJ5129207.1 hypothetical protein N7515_005246 [Penicillium bovifimosum]
MSRTRQPIVSSSFQIAEPRESSARLPATLRLRAEEAPTNTSEESSSSRRIRWSEDVVDNEGMGKKSSKVCCIYHKARPVGESSSEESSSSSSDNDSDSGDDRRTARSGPARRRRSRGRELHSEHTSEPGEECCSEGHGPKQKAKRRKPSPNAYEKMPKPSKNQNQNRPQGT